MKRIIEHGRVRQPVPSSVLGKIDSFKLIWITQVPEHTLAFKHIALELYNNVTANVALKI